MARPRRLTRGRILLGCAALFLFGVFVALGLWQIERRSWKLALIARVDARVHAAPVPAPGPDAWPRIDARERRIPSCAPHRDFPQRQGNARLCRDRSRSRLLGADAARAEGRDASCSSIAASCRPTSAIRRRVRRARSRGRRPSPGSCGSANRAAPGCAPTGPPSIAGTRVTSGRSRRRGGSIPREVAPYFVDADAGTDPGRWPAGGLTRIHFRNAHLQYALTWFAMALLVIVGVFVFIRHERQRSGGGAVASTDPLRTGCRSRAGKALQQPEPSAFRKASSVSELTWCSIPSASMRAVSGAHAERLQEGLDDLMALAAFVRHAAAGFGQEDAAIGFARYQSLGGQSGEHLGDRRLRHAEARGNVHLARLVAVVDEVGDELQIVFHQRVASRLAHLPECLGVALRIGQRPLARNGSMGARQLHSSLLHGDVRRAVITQDIRLTAILPSAPGRFP